MIVGGRRTTPYCDGPCVLHGSLARETTAEENKDMALMAGGCIHFWHVVAMEDTHWSRLCWFRTATLYCVVADLVGTRYSTPSPDFLKEEVCRLIIVFTSIAPAEVCEQNLTSFL